MLITETIQPEDQMLLTIHPILISGHRILHNTRLRNNHPDHSDHHQAKATLQIHPVASTARAAEEHTSVHQVPAHPVAVDSVVAVHTWDHPVLT